MLSLLKAWVWSLVGELKSTNHAVQAKKKKKRFWALTPDQHNQKLYRVRAQPSGF